MKDLILHFFTLPPSKRARIIFYCLQVLFSIVLSSMLYDHYLGEHQMKVSTYDAIIQFFFSGRLIMLLFFFACVWIVFYNIGYFLMRYCNKKVVRFFFRIIRYYVKKGFKVNDEEYDYQKRSMISNSLIKMKALRYSDEEAQKIVRGERFDFTLKFFNQFTETSPKKAYLTPYLLLVFTFQFSIIYFNNFSTVISSTFLDVVVVAAAAFYFIGFFFAVFTLESLTKIADNVKHSLFNPTIPSKAISKLYVEAS